jgi:hypothetical protein
MITLTPEYQAVLESDQMRPVHLIKLPGLNLTTAAYDIAWDGTTYQALGIVLSLDGKRNTSEISANTYKLTLSNADQTALAVLGQNNYFGLPCRIYMGLLDDTGALIVDNDGNGPFEFYSGLYDSYVVNETNTKSTVEVTIRSHWAAYERKAGRWTNTESQQEQYPTDSIFEYAHLSDTEFKWGGRD